LLVNKQFDSNLSKNIYIFSGLGVDERVFQKLHLSGFSATFINWIKPDSNETIENYAARLASKIKSGQPILIGLSFGGLIAIEVAKLIEIDKIILISSAKTRKEIPFYFRFVGLTRLHKIIPTILLKHSNFLTNWLFGTTSSFDKQLLKQILIDTDKEFLKWAIDRIVHWRNMTVINNLTHIHGTKDRILPYTFLKADKTVKSGGHFMILNKANEISTILKEIIN
jgi:pimeloyl-ACP methyl ester carboxylesterase